MNSCKKGKEDGRTYAKQGELLLIIPANLRVPLKKDYFP